MSSLIKRMQNISILKSMSDKSCESLWTNQPDMIAIKKFNWPLIVHHPTLSCFKRTSLSVLSSRSLIIFTWPRRKSLLSKKMSFCVFFLYNFLHSSYVESFITAQLILNDNVSPLRKIFRSFTKNWKKVRRLLPVWVTIARVWHCPGLGSFVSRAKVRRPDVAESPGTARARRGRCSRVQGRKRGVISSLPRRAHERDRISLRGIPARSVLYALWVVGSKVNGPVNKNR